MRNASARLRRRRSAQSSSSSQLNAQQRREDGSGDARTLAIAAASPHARLLPALVCFLARRSFCRQQQQEGSRAVSLTHRNLWPRGADDRVHGAASAHVASALLRKARRPASHDLSSFCAELRIRRAYSSHSHTIQFQVCVWPLDASKAYSCFHIINTYL